MTKAMTSFAIGFSWSRIKYKSQYCAETENAHFRNSLSNFRYGVQSGLMLSEFVQKTLAVLHSFSSFLGKSPRDILVLSYISISIGNFGGTILTAISVEANMISTVTLPVPFWSVISAVFQVSRRGDITNFSSLYVLILVAESVDVPTHSFIASWPEKLTSANSRLSNVCFSRMFSATRDPDRT